MLQSFDAWVIGCYLVATTLFGVWFGRGQTNRTDFFLGSRSLPTWALLLSIVATETSTVTFLSIPGKSFSPDGNFLFLQLAFGYVVGRFAVVMLLFPLHFSGRPMTAYAIFGERFGVLTRRAASLVFLLARTAGDGMRLFLTALALQVALDAPFGWSVLIIAGATAIYSFFGGVKSVVWNDCLQFFVYMLGALIVAWIIVARLPGGLQQIFDFAAETNRNQLIDWRTQSPEGHLTIWSGLLGGAFLSLATHGADQLIVQRYLCASNRKSAAWALLLSGPVVVVQFALFLAIGVGLACYYNEFSPVRLEELSGDQALASFVVNDVGVGVRGVILAAVFAAAMSTLSSSVNSSASSLLEDFFGDWYRNLPDWTALHTARLLTLFFVAAQTAVALGAHWLAFEQSTVSVVLAIAGFSAGLLLGLYFLGLAVGSARSWQAISALAMGIVATTTALAGGYYEWWEKVHWLWFPLIGSGVTLATGLLLVTLVPPADKPRQNLPISEGEGLSHD